MQSLQRFVESKAITNVVIALIVLDAIALGFVSEKMYGHIFSTIDEICVYVFALEILLKLIAFRGAFFKNKWNIFDLVIVVLSILPMFVSFAIFRLFRILKITRLFSTIPQFRFIIAVMLKTLPNAICVSIVLLLIFYVYAILGMQLFGADSTHFDGIEVAMLTLFQIMTGDSWNAIMDSVEGKHPFAWMYFVSFIVLSSFIMLNMFVGVIIDSINEIKSSKTKGDRDTRDV